MCINLVGLLTIWRSCLFKITCLCQWIHLLILRFFCTNSNFTKRRAHLCRQNDLNFQNSNVTRKTTAKGKLIYTGAFVINTYSLPFRFGLNLKILYGLGPSKCLISTISDIFCRAQRNRVFHVEGSGWSPGRYFPVWLAQRLNNSAWVSSLNSGLSTRTQIILKIPRSLSIHSTP